MSSTKADSENFETNDIANLNGADGIILSSNIRYRETRPGRIFRAYTIGLNQSNDSTLAVPAAGGITAAVGERHVGQLLDFVVVCDAKPADAERVADARRSPHGRPRELEHDLQRR